MKTELVGIELARVNSLRDLQILDTERDDAYDAITKLASNIMNCPMAFISLVDNGRQWLKSKVGCDLNVDEISPEHAFCARAILEPGHSMIIKDTHLDKRFADNPMVIGKPNIRFYFGTPLITSDGYAVGTICTLDTIPRNNPTTSQVKAMLQLSRIVITQMELRKLILDIGNEISKVREFKTVENKVYNALKDKSDEILQRIKARKDSI